MRPIDADRLETHEQLEPFGNGNYEYVEVVYKNDIDDAPTIEPERLWIPCSERLPVEIGNYLVTTSRGGVWAKRWDRGWCGNKNNNNIKAWMALPSPYKGDKS